MIKNKLILLIALCSTLFSQAQIDAYRYKAPLKKPTTTWHNIKLNATVFDQAKANLSDIRIFGISATDTFEAPYFTEMLESRIEEEQKTFKILNRTSKGNEFFFTLNRSAQEEISEIDLSFGQSNFDWRVSLEGSNNGNEWFELISNYRIVSISNEQTNFSYTKLVFPPSTYSNFRVRIRHSEAPQLNAAAYGSVTNHIRIAEKILPKSTEITQDKERKSSFILLRFGEKTPISSLNIDANSSFDFYRNIRIYGLVDTLEGFESGAQFLLYSGVFNSIDQGQFDFDQQLVRSILVEIDNNDNQAVNITGVSCFQHPVYITARFDQEADYFLCFGNEEADFPVYDIGYYRDRIPTNLSELSYEIQSQEIAEPKARQATEEFNKIWLWLLIGFIVLLLGYFTLKMMQNKS